MVAGTPLTLRVGFLAGAVGLGIGIILGFLAGYFGGLVDTLIRGAADVLLTVPGLLFLVVLATSLRTAVTVDMMALVVASLAWMLPTRTIRSQVLSMRERAYVQVARLSGMRDLEIIARELLPNLLPYLAASFVSAVGAAVLASIGLEALGSGTAERAYAWDDYLLGFVLHFAAAGNVVVVGAADCDDRADFSSACSSSPWGWIASPIRAYGRSRRECRGQEPRRAAGAGPARSLSHSEGAGARRGGCWL